MYLSGLVEQGITGLVAEALDRQSKLRSSFCGNRFWFERIDSSTYYRAMMQIWLGVLFGNGFGEMLLSAFNESSGFVSIKCVDEKKCKTTFHNRSIRTRLSKGNRLRLIHLCALLSLLNVTHVPVAVLTEAIDSTRLAIGIAPFVHHASLISFVDC